MLAATPRHDRISQEDRDLIAAHYRIAVPLMTQSFARTPLVCAVYPRGLGGSMVWKGPLRVAPPAGAPTCDVPTAHGMRTYLAFSAPAVEWLISHESAVEFHGWGCTPPDPMRARFARVLLELDKQHRDALPQAATALRDLLQRSNLRAIPLMQGTRGMALWIPLAGGPSYPAVRAWLHALCVQAAAADPALFSLEPNTHVSGRVHLHVGSNAPGRYSALPYSLRGDEDLRMCAPIAWEEVSAAREGDFTARSFFARLAAVGDLFAVQLEQIGAQTLPEPPPPPPSSAVAQRPPHGKPIEPHGRILQAAVAVLEDGRPRDAQTILNQALARHLVPAGTKEKYVYTSLLEYIVRTSGHGHKPLVVQDVDRRFRLNEPKDGWPDLAAPPLPPLDAATTVLVERLGVTAVGDDSTAFEVAVCDAFAHLGFSATHVGGNENPDGYVDAQLGMLGYRAMIECKTGERVVHNPDTVEASKYKDAYEAAYCAIVGPGFGENLELAGELQTHRVSAWTASDLQQLLRIRSNPHEMRPLFEPGFVSDVIGDLLWTRVHGVAKRVTLICNYLQAAGWDAQVAFAKTGQGDAADAPRLTIDAAMLLVDQRLVEAGAAVACARSEVRAAFAYLTNPRVGAAVLGEDGERESIVILHSAARGTVTHDDYGANSMVSAVLMPSDG